MHRSLISLLLLACNVSFAAEDKILTLRNNPFSQPEILKARPQPVAPTRVVVPAEEVELNLTATLVSDARPMVKVDDEFLGIGDKIEGMELIAVSEGKAVFVRAGKRYEFEIAGQAER